MVRIQNGGAGGFLNPPTHPEHTLHIGDRNNSLSLSYALTPDASWIDASVKADAKRILDEWEANKPALETPELQEWVLQVLGYFRGCYRGAGNEPECWNVSELIIYGGKNGDNARYCNVDNHAGVHFIRQYYPEYVPTDGQFDNAYWGTKPAK